MLKRQCTVVRRMLPFTDFRICGAMGISWGFIFAFKVPRNRIFIGNHRGLLGNYPSNYVSYYISIYIIDKCNNSRTFCDLGVP